MLARRRWIARMHLQRFVEHALIHVLTGQRHREQLTPKNMQREQQAWLGAIEA